MRHQASLTLFANFTSSRISCIERFNSQVGYVTGSLIRTGTPKLHSPSVSDMRLSPDKCVFVVKTLLKTSRPGRHISSLGFAACNGILSCVITYMVEYVKRTSPFRQGAAQLLFRDKKPNK